MGYGQHMQATLLFSHSLVAVATVPPLDMLPLVAVAAVPPLPGSHWWPAVVARNGEGGTPSFSTVPAQ